MSASVAAPPQWQHEWESALGALELDVRACEELLHALHAQQDLPDGDEVMRARWQPPATIGPIPRPLVERAGALLRRQHDVAQQLALAAHRNRLHLKVAEQAAGGVRAATPVYLDVAL
jgi:hypothetical protein